MPPAVAGSGSPAPHGVLTQIGPRAQLTATDRSARPDLHRNDGACWLGIAAKCDALNFRLRSCAEDELALIIAENSRGDSAGRSCGAARDALLLSSTFEAPPALPLWRDDVAALVALDLQRRGPRRGCVFLIRPMSTPWRRWSRLRRFDEPVAPAGGGGFACDGFLRCAPAWRSTLYTFSDVLYREVACAPRLLVRCCVSPLMSSYGSGRSPSTDCPIPACDPRPPFQPLGLKSADAEHVVDAIGLRC